MMKLIVFRHVGSYKSHTASHPIRRNSSVMVVLPKESGNLTVGEIANESVSKALARNAG
jgi:hypothetical protein